VKIYMLLIDDNRFFFFEDESELAHEDDGSEPETRQSSGHSWVRSRLAKFRAAWHHAGSGALYWMRSVWDWLHTLVRPDESMLGRLWSATKIQLHHPANRSEVDVRADWRRYLDRQWRRHFFWFAINALAAPPSVILAVLPGPNVIGFWFAYRAIHHGLVVWGISRARRERVPIELHALEALDVPIEQDDDGNARHAALEGAGEHLGKHVAWWRGSVPAESRRDRPSSRTASSEPSHVI
jgi:hypothetical protein